MKRLLFILILFLGGEQTAFAADWTDAVIRFPSHGCSATIIWTETGRSFLLGCSHAYWKTERIPHGFYDKPMKFDGLEGCQFRLVKVDNDLDLSLVEVDKGPLPLYCPVAGTVYQPSLNIVSVGYDRMAVPATKKRATIIKSDDTTTWTREPPWHGRSGGGLIDLDAGRLIGVVSGYVSYPNGPGIYVSHRAILRFLQERQAWKPLGATNQLFNPQPQPKYYGPQAYPAPRCPT